MKRKYFVLAVNYAQEDAVAYPEKPLIGYELTDKIIEDKKVSFELFLKNRVDGTDKKILVDSLRQWPDFIANSLAWPLFSERMKNVIQENLKGTEGVYWLPVNINTKKEKVTYYLTCFESKLDVLDMNKSKFVGSMTVLPVFSLKKIIKFEIFQPPSSLWKISPLIYVSEKIRAVLEEKNMRGLKFEDTRIVD